jgi:HEXXH motif-containing protein
VVSLSLHANMDPADILWSSLSCYEERFEKSAAALIAVERALAGDASAESSQFRRLFAFLAEAEPEHFDRVWRDPSAYYWVRRTVHFLAAIQGAPMGTTERAYCVEANAAGPAHALSIHLTEFKRFALSVAILSQQALAFDKPLVVTLPFAIPGTDLTVGGRGIAAIHKVSGSCIEATYQGRRTTLRLVDAPPKSEPRLTRCASVEYGRAQITLNPALFHLPGLGLSREWGEPDFDFQRRNSGSLADALSIVASVQPDVFVKFCYAVRTIALKPMREGSFSSLSTSELPGAFICSLPCNSYELAATLVHEFFHDRLFAIEENGAFFENTAEDSIEGENHYSPWRDGPRPLHGLFHALYVYVAVFRFWAALIKARPLKPIELAYARDQLARIPFQLRIGISQLRRFAQFTVFGRMLFEQLAAETSVAEDWSRALGVSIHASAVSLRADGRLHPRRRNANGRPSSVAETLLEHLELHDSRNECREERLTLDWALASNIQER